MFFSSEYHASFSPVFLQALESRALQDLFVIITKRKFYWNARANREYFNLNGVFKSAASARWLHVTSMKTSRLWHQVANECIRRDLRWDKEVHDLFDAEKARLSILQ